MSKPCVLVVDDEADIRELVQDILIDEGYFVMIAANGEQAREARRARKPDLVLLDIWMPDIDGISLLQEWSDPDAGLPFTVVMMSGHGTVEHAVEATRLGAYDFLEKPLTLPKLLLVVKRALESGRLIHENRVLKQQIKRINEPIGRSDATQRLKDKVSKIAAHDHTPVLIRGEPGTGKKMYARYLHDLSPRREAPFVEVGVASIARENAATELFGVEMAGQVRYGLLEQAIGGTLFLNDLADMDVDVQAKLASALETRHFLRVGGSEPVTVNVRVIASTHQDLEGRIAEGRFREDLFYQINVVPITMPALRDHPEDVPDLLNFYINYFMEEEGAAYRHFTMVAQNRLRHYPWPGNIRELKNLVHRLLILGGQEDIGLEEVETALSQSPSQRDLDLSNMIPLELPLREARELFERTYLLLQFKECDGNVARLADKVGMERTNLYRKLRALGIDPKKGNEDE